VRKNLQTRRSSRDVEPEARVGSVETSLRFSERPPLIRFKSEKTVSRRSASTSSLAGFKDSLKSLYIGWRGCNKG